MRIVQHAVLCSIGILILFNASSVRADSPVERLRVSPTSSPTTDDIRSQPLKDLNGHFSFSPPADLASWQSRAEDLRMRIRVATGLWPMPDRTPLNPVIHGKVKRDGFTIEKVYFESVPGHFVTGLLFRPEHVNGKVPGVLCPHGHGGRLDTASIEQVREMIVKGEERFEASGRTPKLARCAELARMGCVALIFDMIGYADSQQLSHELAHGYGETRPEYKDGKTVGEGEWGFYTVQAESRLQTIMGLQTWNAIRALDFLEQLPDVDPTRLAVTGNSGGGTQTILLGAIDERPVVSFPNGMVSVAMQGGCTCENCSLLRIGTGNVELAALMAPRPQAMTAANDWTIEMMSDGYPQLQQIYSLYGKPNNVLCRDYTHFPHNFNYVTRAMMYSWMNRHLNLGLQEPIVEQDWPALAPSESTVWDDEHPQPARGDEYERSLTAYLDKQSNSKIDSLLNKNTKSLDAFRNVVGKAWNTIIGRELPEAQEIERELISQIEIDGYRVDKEIVRLVSKGESIPIVSVFPSEGKNDQPVVIWVDGDGKSSLLNDQGKWTDKAKSFLENGSTIVAADLFGQGESRTKSDDPTQQRVVDNPRQYAGYTFTYNAPLFVKRTNDVMTLIAMLSASTDQSNSWLVYGRNGAEPIAAAAVAAAVSTGAHEDAGQLTLQQTSFRFDDLKNYRDPYFVPGAVKYGDLPGLLALAASVPIQVEKGALTGLAKTARSLVLNPPLPVEKP